MRFAPALLLIALCLAAIPLAACGGSESASAGVTIEPITATAAPLTQLVGGKPEATATPADAPAQSEAAPTDAPPTSTPVPAEPTATPAPAATATPDPRETLAHGGRWIDVDVTSYIVRLMDGENVVQEIAPVAVGAQIDTGAYASTQTGLFYVFNKVEGLAYDPPYDTYISHWVGFDPDKANGFHSFLKDKDGKVVDASTGRVSNGCIRTGAPEAIFAFAQIGTPVWVHV